MRNFQLEKYFDNDLYLVRFNNIQDLEKRFKEDENLNIVDFSFRSDYDNDFSDYELNLTVEDTDKTKYDLYIWYAVTRIGERIIVETNFEECE
jgi:hypothetical protein